MLDWSDSLVKCAHRRMLRSCATLGVHGADADDVAQQVWLWLLRLPDRGVNRLDTPWLEAVTRNFVRRRRREELRRQSRERRWLESTAQVRSEPDRERILERKWLLRRMAERLSSGDRDILSLIRLGFTFAEAAAKAGVPRGSRGRVHQRLVRCGRSLVAA